MPPFMTPPVFCVQILSDMITGGSMIAAQVLPLPNPAPPAGTACALPNSGGNALGLITLTIPMTSASDDFVSLFGCIEGDGDSDCGGPMDVSSPVIFINVVSAMM